MKATLIDGSPLKGQSVEIIVRASKKTSHHWLGTTQEVVFQKRFTVPANGVITFVVPGESISQDTKSLSLKVS